MKLHVPSKMLHIQNRILHIQNSYLKVETQDDETDPDEKFSNQTVPDHLRLSPFFLFWALVFFSFMGYAVEMLYEIIKFGEHASRQGLIYGPFSQIYGIGAVIGIVASRRFHNRSLSFIFAFCAVLGSFYEYFSSLFMEKIFSAVPWNYDQLFLNINGRTSLKFSIYWAVIGTIIIKHLYPMMCKLLRKIPSKRALAITWLVFILVATDSFLTVTALTRYSERYHKIPADTKFEVFLDTKYPDSFMKTIYPDMKFK